MGIAIAFYDRHFFRDIERETVRGTDGYTGGFQPLVDSIHTIIAFDNFSDFRIPLGSPPGTRGNTGFTSHTEIVVHENDTVLFAALHGTGGAGGDTPRVFTVKTWHENKGRPGFVVKEFGSHRYDLTGPGFRRKRFVYLALNFT